MSAPHPEFRELERDEVGRVWSIDRSELIDRIYRHTSGGLVLEPRRYDVRGWPPGEPERYGPILLDCFDRGGSFFGAFESGVLVGVAVLDVRLFGTPADRLQLVFLHVSRSARGSGIGRALFGKVVERARALGARRLYISATASENTVHFYQRLGCRVADEVDPALFAAEPEDIHFDYDLQPG